MDLHGFFLVLFFSVSFFISQILDLSVWEDDADFCSHELEKDYADFSNSLLFMGILTIFIIIIFYYVCFLVMILSKFLLFKHILLFFLLFFKENCIFMLLFLIYFLTL